jgi:hypothetical protein
MATFYSSIQGTRGEANRCGSKESGIRAAVQSYDGSIETRLSLVNGKVWAYIGTATGSSSYGSNAIYHGPLEDLLTQDGRINLLKQIVTAPLRPDRPTPEAIAYYDHADHRASA